jgi:tellurite resistance-related uncharacterized protein
MQRAIIDFGRDDEGDWYALLDCAHRQHVRHRPPFTNRPWVMSAAGRAGKLGEQLDCLRCDRFEWPDDILMYKRTADFDQESVPRGLQRDHRTRAGVWGRIVIVQGLLRYHVDEMDVHRDLVPGTTGVILPQVSHRVEVTGDVRFFVEFHALAPSR